MTIVQSKSSKNVTLEFSMWIKDFIVVKLDCVSRNVRFFSVFPCGISYNFLLAARLDTNSGICMDSIPSVTERSEEK